MPDAGGQSCGPLYNKKKFVYKEESKKEIKKHSNKELEIISSVYREQYKGKEREAI